VSYIRSVVNFASRSQQNPSNSENMIERLFLAHFENTTTVWMSEIVLSLKETAPLMNHTTFIEIKILRRRECVTSSLHMPLYTDVELESCTRATSEHLSSKLEAKTIEFLTFHYNKP
jgi:hypothetical protein